MRGIAVQPHPAGIDIAAIGLAKAGRGAHDAVFEDAADAVGRLVQRVELAGGELRRLAEYRVGQLRLDQPAERRHRVDREAHVLKRRGIRHRPSL